MHSQPVNGSPDEIVQLLPVSQQASQPQADVPVWHLSAYVPVLQDVLFQAAVPGSRKASCVAPRGELPAKVRPFHIDKKRRLIA